MVHYLKDANIYSGLLLRGGEKTGLLPRPESVIAALSILKPLNRSFSYSKSSDIVLKRKFIPFEP
jgi:hypothetical protein